CFDRVDNEFKEAIAWIPQSTVAIITNTGIREVDRHLPYSEVQFLLQVHDSAVFQVRTKDAAHWAREIQRLMTIEVPYSPRPLKMVPGCKASEHSWGECEDMEEWFREAA